MIEQENIIDDNRSIDTELGREYIGEDNLHVVEKSKGFVNILLKHEKVSVFPIENTQTDRLEGVRIEFNELNERTSYFKSDGTGVQGMPENLFIDFNIQNLAVFSSYLLGAVSSYLYNIRQKVDENMDVTKIIKFKKFNNEKYLKITLSKHFFRKKTKGRYKINISFMDSRTGEEIISFQLTKRDVVLLLKLIKSITNSYLKETAIYTKATYIDAETKEEIAEKEIAISKVFDSISIDGVWLHGQELLNLMFVLHESIEHLYIEKKLKTLYGFYRQLTFFGKDEILYIDISKMNEKHEFIYLDYEDKKIKVRIAVGAMLLATLYLYLDVDILKHDKYEDESDEESNMNSLATKYDLSHIQNYVFLKETYLGVGINKELENKDENAPGFCLAGIAKKSNFESDEEGNHYVLHYDENNMPQRVPLLEEFNINLKEHWVKLVKALIYAFTKEYKEDKREFDLVKFFIIEKDKDKNIFKYDFRIHANEDNKAGAVINIDKYLLRKGEKQKIVAKFRQPLFRKYNYQLLIICLAAAEEIEEFNFVHAIPNNKLLPFKYYSYNNVRKNTNDKSNMYGIKKIDNEVYWGNFTSTGSKEVLLEQDVKLLHLSSEYRIFHPKRWIPFTGEKISVSQNGYITDMYSEFDLEELDKGIYKAIEIYYATNI